MSVGRRRQAGSSCLESNFSYSWLPDYPGSVSERASSGSTVAHSRKNATQHGVTALKSQRRGGSSSSSSKAKRNERKQSKKNSKRTEKELQNNWKKELKERTGKNFIKELNQANWAEQNWLTTTTTTTTRRRALHTQLRQNPVRCMCAGW